MKTNPFEIKTKNPIDFVMNWNMIYPKSYDKKKVDPFTKLRIILMNGTEFESVWFLHQMARTVTDHDLKREMALIRNSEQQQQKRLACLKPLDEHFLETTIGYEQLAIELTSILAQNETDKNNLDCLNLALLEDFDHLFRFANLLKKDFKIEAETLLGKLTEVMPGRPTISEHRHPYDQIKYSLNSKKADLNSRLTASIITAAEQQTMNFYMNMAANYPSDIGRKLYGEIAMIEEIHVSQYESLLDPNATFLENWLMHEYCECYLYHSMAQDETDPYIKGIYEEHFEMEVSHLKTVERLLKKYEKKDASLVLPNSDFPKLLKFNSNKDYVRKVLNDVYLTSDREKYIDVRKLDKSADFFNYNKTVNSDVKGVPSHAIINESIHVFNGTDYRYQDSPHPIKDLDDRKKDNTSVGRE
ncbi:MAG: hypothetical protein FWE22_04460 [Firmicutes bacterium]|nr:hypothetical protein [Bacillota bacterium]